MAFREHLVALGCIVILIAAVGRLLGLCDAEYRQVLSARDRETFVPQYGSFHAIGPGGPLPDGHRDPPEWRFLFLLRSSQLESDRDFWNEVIRRTMQGEAPISYWGVCDTGNACDAAQGSALFSVVGFLDPHQMRIVGLAAGEGDALLYNAQGGLVGTLPAAREPASTASRIESLVR